jgi:hypothetical protein
MALSFRNIPKILLVAASLVYPILIFYFLVIRETPIRILSLFIIAVALLVFITRTSKKKEKLKLLFYLPSSCSAPV